MRVKLTEDRQIKGKLHEAGDEVIVNKEAGERMIGEGVANRLIAPPENRIRGLPEGRQVFRPYKRFGR